MLPRDEVLIEMASNTSTSPSEDLLPTIADQAAYTVNQPTYTTVSPPGTGPGSFQTPPRLVGSGTVSGGDCPTW